MALTPEQTLDLFRSDDLLGLGMEADAVRRRLHPEGVVTYLLDARLDCTAGAEGSGEFAAVLARAAEAEEAGASGLRLHGLGIEADAAERLVAALRLRFPRMTLQACSAAEIAGMTDAAGRSPRSLLERLRGAGLDSIAVDGPALQRDGGAAWLAVHRAAHQAGLRTVAAMVFGSGESAEQRSSFIAQVRGLQEETGGFAAFAPRSAKAGREWEEATAVEYLKVLAVSRLYLDNIENIQADWTAQGLKVLQMALRFGANDAGSVMPGAVQAGAATEEELRHAIRGADLQPVQRDALYRVMLLA